MLIRRLAPLLAVVLVAVLSAHAIAQNGVRSGGLGQLLFDGKVRLQIADIKTGSAASYGSYSPDPGLHYVIVHGTLRNGTSAPLNTPPFTATLFDAAGTAIKAAIVPPIESNANVSEIVTQDGGTYNLAPGAGIRVQFAFAIPGTFVPASVTLKPRDAGWGTFSVKLVAVAAQPKNKAGGAYEVKAIAGGLNQWLTDGVVALRVTSFAPPPPKNHGTYSIGSDKHYMVVKATLRNVGKAAMNETAYTPSLSDANGVVVDAAIVPSSQFSKGDEPILSLNDTAYNIPPQGTWKFQMAFAVPNDFVPAKLLMLPYHQGAWKAFRITLPASK